jgi:uncharacterized membrane protein YbaN (DUF454 family)
MGGANGRLRTGPSGVGVGAGVDDGPWPRMASDESSGVLRVRDPRVFRAGGRAFCRLWLDAALRLPRVRKAGVDLATATALIEFEPGAATPTTATMAEAFSEAVLEALTNPSPATATDRSNWVSLVGYSGSDSPAWEVSRRSSNRLELRPPGPASGLRRADWLGRVAEADGVLGCRSAWFSDALTVAYDPASTNEDRVLDAVRLAWLESDRSAPASRSSTPGTAMAIDPRARTMNLVKAGGSFVMTLVGIVVPGIPTVPFLLGTSYYLARSSPRLNGLLLRSPIFGGVLREWEEHQALSLGSKAKLLGLSAAIVTITILTIPVNAPALVVILLITAASVYATLRIPGLPAPEGGEPRTVLALG